MYHIISHFLGLSKLASGPTKLATAILLTCVPEILTPTERNHMKQSMHKIT